MAFVMPFAPLEKDTVRVRWLSVVPEDAPHIARWRTMLDAGELAQADRFRFESDRTIYTAAHALARAMLSETTGAPTAHWRYERGPVGKPSLAAECRAGGLQFNISHTRGFVACALGWDDLGVDVEASDRMTNFAIADRFFSPEEAALVNSAPEVSKPYLFFRFWTLKEAFIKSTGEGLRRPLDSFSFTFHPIRVTFHPEREQRPRHDDPAEWRFHESHPAPFRPLALAVRRPGGAPFRLDAQAAQAAEVGPR